MREALFLLFLFQCVYGYVHSTHGSLEEWNNGGYTSPALQNELRALSSALATAHDYEAQSKSSPTPLNQGTCLESLEKLGKYNRTILEQLAFGDSTLALMRPTC